MTFEEWADQIWEQIGRLEAEYVQMEHRLKELKAQEGELSPKAEALMRQISELGEHLLRLDEEYSALLKQGGWMER